MKFSMLFILGLFVVMAVCCTTEEVQLTEENIKSEVRIWWGAKIFENVIVEDTVRVKNTYEVTARVVVCFDTLKQMKYVFKRYKRGWRVNKGPVDEKTKRSMIEEMLDIPLNAAKNNIILSNMRDLQRALMRYASVNDGRLPVNLNVKQYELAYSVRELLGPYMKNPYIQGAPAVMVAHGDSSEWLPEYEGKVIYFPLDVDFDGVFAEGYMIKGSTDKKFLRFVIRSREMY